MRGRSQIAELMKEPLLGKLRWKVVALAGCSNLPEDVCKIEAESSLVPSNLHFKVHSIVELSQMCKWITRLAPFPLMLHSTRARTFHKVILDLSLIHI